MTPGVPGWDPRPLSSKQHMCRPSPGFSCFDTNNSRSSPSGEGPHHAVSIFFFFSDLTGCLFPFPWPQGGTVKCGGETPRHTLPFQVLTPTPQGQKPDKNIFLKNKKDNTIYFRSFSFSYELSSALPYRNLNRNRVVF